MENTNILLPEEQIKGLKSYVWEKNYDTDTFYIGGISIECFTALTGYDLVTLNELKNPSVSTVSMGWDLIYGRPGTDEKHPTSYYFQGVVYIDNKIFNEKYFVSDVDFLGLYTNEEENTDNLSEEEIIKKLSSALALATDNVDIDRIVDLIDNNFADVSDRMREKFCKNLEVDDIGDILKADIAEDWIGQNPDDAYDRAVDHMCSSDIRDKVIDYINYNLN